MNLLPKVWKVFQGISTVIFLTGTLVAIYSSFAGGGIKENQSYGLPNSVREELRKDQSKLAEVLSLYTKYEKRGWVSKASVREIQKILEVQRLLVGEGAP